MTGDAHAPTGGAGRRGAVPPDFLMVVTGAGIFMPGRHVIGRGAAALRLIVPTNGRV